MNIIGRTIFFLLLIGIGYAITSGIIIQENNNIRFLIPRFLIGVLIFIVFMALPTFIQRTTTKVVKDQLTKVLGLPTNG
ncbi:MAG TPA: hypothetical protein DGG95_12780 [Cytophagales bacterium]|jgi:hypothetical protein|nr:hypothetical protein [Cytophagales bacterium]